MSGEPLTLHELLSPEGEDLNPYFCRARKGPMLLQSFMVELLQEIYSNEAHLGKHIKPFTKDGKGVQIKLAGVWSDSSNPGDSAGSKVSVDYRPAIAVDLGDVNTDYRKVQGIDNEAHYDLVNAISTSKLACNTSFTIKHLGSSKAQVQLYAETTRDLLDGFSKGIKNDYCLDIFEIRSIVKAKLRNRTPEDWECALQIYVEFEDSFKTYTESPKIKEITTDIIIN